MSIKSSQTLVEEAKKSIENLKSENIKQLLEKKVELLEKIKSLN